jgi:hypothetical protein
MIVDLWSVIHFGFFAFLASSVAAAWEPRLWVHAVYGLLTSYGWETFEYFGQRKWPEVWSGRIESWSNSWVGDPIVNMLGVLFGWFVVAYYRGRLKRGA